MRRIRLEWESLDPPGKRKIESEEGKALLKKWGIEGRIEGIGHCVLGYAAAELPPAKPRKENYVYYVEA